MINVNIILNEHYKNIFYFIKKKNDEPLIEKVNVEDNKITLA